MITGKHWGGKWYGVFIHLANNVKIFDAVLQALFYKVQVQGKGWFTFASNKLRNHVNKRIFLLLLEKSKFLIYAPIFSQHTVYAY